MRSRTFVVTVSEAPARVLIEDVRSGQRTFAAGLPDVAAKIASWLEAPPATREPDIADEARR